MCSTFQFPVTMLEGYSTNKYINKVASILVGKYARIYLCGH